MPPRYQNLDEVTVAVEQNHGLMTFPMSVLRDAVGAKALGRKVRKQISEGLSKRQIKFLPKKYDRDFGELPPRYQQDSVRLYKSDSPAAGLIEAAQEPTAENDNRLLQALAWIRVLDGQAL